jgi:peptide chain release factor subunit 1
VDANDCLIAFMKGIQAEILWSDSSFVPRKQDAGGQSAVRFQRNREIALHAWFKECNSHLNEVFKSIHMKDIKFLLGINKCNEKDFLDNMHSYIHGRLIGIDTVGYVSINGCEELMTKCAKLIKDYRVTKDKEIVDEWGRLLAKQSPLVDYGVCALNPRRNKLILYSDKIDVSLLDGVICEKRLIKGFCIVDSLQICVFNHY